MSNGAGLSSIGYTLQSTEIEYYLRLRADRTLLVPLSELIKGRDVKIVLVNPLDENLPTKDDIEDASVVAG